MVAAFSAIASGELVGWLLEMWSDVSDLPQVGGGPACEGDPNATPICGDSFALEEDCGAWNVALLGGIRGEGVGKRNVSAPDVISIV